MQNALISMTNVESQLISESVRHKSPAALFKSEQSKDQTAALMLTLWWKDSKVPVICDDDDNILGNILFDIFLKVRWEEISVSIIFSTDGGPGLSQV